MLSAELRERVSAMAEKYRQQELDFLEMLGRIDSRKTQQSKPRIRVSATSYRWSIADTSETGIARGQ